MPCIKTVCSYIFRDTAAAWSLLNNVGLSTLNRGLNHLVASLMHLFPLAERSSLLWSWTSCYQSEVSSLIKIPCWHDHEEQIGMYHFSVHFLRPVCKSKVLTYFITLRTTSAFSVYSCLSPRGWMLDLRWRNKLWVWTKQQIRNKLKVKLLAWICPLQSPWDFPPFRHAKSLCLSGTIFFCLTYHSILLHISLTLKMIEIKFLLFFPQNGFANSLFQPYGDVL